MVLDSSHSTESTSVTLGLLGMFTNPRAFIKDSFIKQAVKQLNKHTFLMNEEVEYLKSIPQSKEFVDLEQLFDSLKILLEEQKQELINIKDPKLFVLKNSLNNFLKSWNKFHEIIAAKSESYQMSEGVKRLNRRTRNRRTFI